MLHPAVAIVLPPREGFSPEAVGAIGLLVHRLVRGGAAGTVIGEPPAFVPFADVPFVPAPPGLGFDRTSRYAAGVARVLRRLGPALIEVHNRPELALRLAARFPQTPVTLWLNNDPQGMRRARTPPERTALLQRAACVITASDWIRRRLLQGVGRPARAPVVLPNCIDVPPLPTAPREKLILFAGRVVADKGADVFVAACAEALQHLPGWRAEIIGADRFSPTSPETPFLRVLRPRAEAAGIVLRGHLPHDAVIRAMSRAAIVAMPSRWEEPFGLSALEALACGTPLVCSPRGGLPQVAGEAALYADPDRPGAWAEAFCALAADPARREIMTAMGHARAQRFDTRHAVAELLALRRAILAA